MTERRKFDQAVRTLKDDDGELTLRVWISHDNVELTTVGGIFGGQWYTGPIPLSLWRKINEFVTAMTAPEAP